MKLLCRSRVWCAAGCLSVLLSQTPAFAQDANSPRPSIVQTPSTDSLITSPTPPAQRAATPEASSGLTLPGADVPNLFADLIGDFKRLPSGDAARWLSIGASIALVGHVGDSGLTRAMANDPALHEAFESGSVIGGTPVQVGGALATYAIGRMTGSSRTAKVGSELFRAQIVTQTMTSIMKVSVGRSRPDGTSYSFPSGHTASAFATATVLQRNFGWKAGIPAYALASYVAASRIQAQRHYLSDVAFGAALGILAGRTVTVGPSSAKFALAPFAVEGGAGVNFNWVGGR